MNHRITLRVAIDCYCSLFLILIIFVLYVEVDELKDKFVHVQTFLLLECEHTLVIEEIRQRTGSTECSVELVEHRTHVAYGTCGVVGKRIYEDCYSVRAISLISNLLIVALVLAKRVLDGTLDVILRHVLTLTCCDDRTQ